jgi:hypothetical protein
VYFRSRKQPSLRTALIAIVVGLFAIAMLREVRAVGLGSTDGLQAGGNAFDGLTELGGTLRSVSEVVLWSQLGEQQINGASYWAPVDRAACAVVPDGHCVPAYDDDRLMNVLVQQRVGAIGFSPIAEGFRNFGWSGVVVVMALIGILLGALDQLRPSMSSQAIVGVVLVELFINVRNAFVPVPSHIIGGLIFVLLIRIAANSSSTAQPRPARSVGAHSVSAR